MTVAKKTKGVQLERNEIIGCQFCHLLISAWNMQLEVSWATTSSFRRRRARPDKYGDVMFSLENICSVHEHIVSEKRVFEKEPVYLLTCTQSVGFGKLQKSWDTFYCYTMKTGRSAVNDGCGGCEWCHNFHFGGRQQTLWHWKVADTKPWVLKISAGVEPNWKLRWWDSATCLVLWWQKLNRLLKVTDYIL